MRPLLVVLLAACSAPAKPSAPAAPAAGGSAGPDVELHVIMDGTAALPCDGDVTLGVHGLVAMADRSPAAGVTVVVKLAGGSEAVGITDDKGCYAIATPAAGSATIYLYYGNVTHEQATAVPSGGFGRVDATIRRDGTEP